jgi:carbon storage regulator CsrA
MLTLSRRKCGSIVVNADIVFAVVESGGNNIKICINAPGEIPVRR